MSHDHTHDTDPKLSAVEAETRKDANRPYEVGYGAPPKHTRFKPGRSGNPKGRPKKHRNLRTIIKELLHQPVRVTQRGKTKTVPAFAAAYQQVLGQALKGDLRALLVLMQAAERAGLVAEEHEHMAEAPLSTEEEALLGRMRRRYGMAPDQEPDIDASHEQIAAEAVEKEEP